MAKIIICNGKRARTPFHIELTGVNIYSIEELSYYIYHNIYMMSEEIFTYELADFMEHELGLKERADKLRNILLVHGSLKDIIVCILCSCDYLTEHEIKSLIHVIDEISDLTPIRRKKLLADQCLSYHNYAKAKVMYQAILDHNDVDTLDEKEKGSLLHNMGITVLHLSGFEQAAELFSLAYEHSHNMESLHQYLLALKCAGEEEKYQKELESLTNGHAMNHLIHDELTKMDRAFSETNESKIMIALKQLKLEGRMALYQREVGHLLSKWKQEYRQQNVLQEG